MTPLLDSLPSCLGSFIYLFSSLTNLHSSSLCHYLFSGVVSFSLLAGASCRSGRLAKSSCSARPIARDRTTIFPSLDTQDRPDVTEQHMWTKKTGTGGTHAHVAHVAHVAQSGRHHGPSHTATQPFHGQRKRVGGREVV